LTDAASKLCALKIVAHDEVHMQINQGLCPAQLLPTGGLFWARFDGGQGDGGGIVMEI